MALQAQDLNAKEKKLFKALSDGEQHSIRELKKLFAKEAREHCAKVYAKGWGDAEVDIQAQSFVRNSMRVLVEAGWVKRVSRGVVQMREGARRRLGIELKKAA